MFSMNPDYDNYLISLRLVAIAVKRFGFGFGTKFIEKESLTFLKRVCGDKIYDESKYNTLR